MSTRAWLASLVGVAASASLLTGCQQLQCADGTHEANGECVAGNPTSDATCGPGTHLENSLCKPDFDPTICDPTTTIAQTDPDTGEIVCVGVGGSGCAGALPCPSDHTSGHDNICGRLIDVQTESNITAAAPTGAECGNGGEADGPCQLDVQFYDALLFAGDPTGTAPQSLESLYIDDCGRFVAKNVAHPGLNFMGIGVDDKSTEADLHRLTGVAFPLGSGDIVSKVRAYSVTKATDLDWSGDVLFAPTNTFVDRGVFVSYFLYGNVPVEGVTVTAAGSPLAANDYYMDDLDPASRTSVSMTQAQTGPNGIGIITGVNGLQNYSGTGAEQSGCRWPTDMGAAIQGVMFFNPRREEVNTTTECP